MSKPAYLSWDNFRTTILVFGQQRVHRVAVEPLVEMFGDGSCSQIGIWIEIAPDTVIPPELSALQLVRTRTLTRQGRFLLEVATSAEPLHRQFYHFAVAVAERIVVEKLSATEAVRLELLCFAELLKQRSVLGIERQIGLTGELVFLEHLVGKYGTGALDAWLGPTGEPHDFRRDINEFEIKTTLASKRIHTINGAEQLIPSQGCSLFLVSVLLGPPGAGPGFSLVDVVLHISTRFSSDQTRLQHFESLLTSCGYRAADAGHYDRRYTMRRPMGLVSVDTAFPSITRTAIQRLLGPLATRVDHLQYDVNVEGLEHEEGSGKFNLALPI